MRENIEKELTAEKNLPSLLDVVKIDGRWAQVMGGGGYVRFLDGKKFQEVDWDNYTLTKRFHSNVKNLQEIHGERIPEEEARNVHWESVDQEEHPNLRGEVTVFGEYKKN
jgi:hypothetical protein